MQMKTIVSRFCRLTVSVVDTTALATFWLICLLASANGQTPPSSESGSTASTPSIAFAARIAGNEERFRLLIDFDRAPDPDVYVLDNPRRLIVDLPLTVFSLDDSSRQSASTLVSDVRYGAISPKQGRVVIALAHPVAVISSTVTHLKDEQRHRLVIDLVKSDEVTFAKAAEEAADKQKAGRVAVRGDRIERSKPGDKRFTIVIDPGHGGIDGGATGRGGTVEKNVTLAFAKALEERLVKDKRLRVVLTRRKDVFVSLQDRLAVARRNKADLLISIHADSLRQHRIRGATIYTLSKEGSDELSRELAEEQNRADVVAGLGLPELEESTTDILIELTRRETAMFSTHFARILVQRLRDGVRLIRNPRRSGDFFVLRAADIPSALVELGYLSNREDEKQMRSEAWREKGADLMAQAVVAFFEPRFESIAQ